LFDFPPIKMYSVPEIGLSCWERFHYVGHLMLVIHYTPRLSFQCHTRVTAPLLRSSPLLFAGRKNQSEMWRIVERVLNKKKFLV
jgi:hypothetical protein